MTALESIFAFLSWLDLKPMLPRLRSHRNRKRESVRLGEDELLGCSSPRQEISTESSRFRSRKAFRSFSAPVDDDACFHLRLPPLIRPKSNPTTAPLTSEP